MRPREHGMKLGRKVSLIVQLPFGGFLRDSDRSAQNFWLKLPLHRKQPQSHFLAQSKNFPVGVKQKKKPGAFCSPTNRYIVNRYLFLWSLSKWVINEKQMELATKWTTCA